MDDTVCSNITNDISTEKRYLIENAIWMIKPGQNINILSNNTSIYSISFWIASLYASFSLSYYFCILQIAFFY